MTEKESSAEQPASDPQSEKQPSANHVPRFLGRKVIKNMLFSKWGKRTIAGVAIAATGLIGNKVYVQESVDTQVGVISSSISGGWDNAFSHKSEAPCRRAFMVYQAGTQIRSVPAAINASGLFFHADNVTNTVDKGDVLVVEQPLFVNDSKYSRWDGFHLQDSAYSHATGQLGPSDLVKKLSWIDTASPTRQAFSLAGSRSLTVVSDEACAYEKTGIFVPENNTSGAQEAGVGWIASLNVACSFLRSAVGYPMDGCPKPGK